LHSEDCVDCGRVRLRIEIRSGAEYFGSAGGRTILIFLRGTGPSYPVGYHTAHAEVL